MQIDGGLDKFLSEVDGELVTASFTKNLSVNSKYFELKDVLKEISTQQFCDLVQKQLIIKSKSLKTTDVLYHLQFHDCSLVKVIEALFLPQVIQLPVEIQRMAKNSQVIEKIEIKKKLIPLILTHLRNEKSMNEICHKLEISNISRYHHYEVGIRDLPFLYFVNLLKFSEKILNFIECLPDVIRSNLFISNEANTKKTNDLKFSEIFFSKPWLPTLYLLIQTPSVTSKENLNKQVLYLSKVLGLNSTEVFFGLQQLMNLQLIVVEGNKLQVLKGQFFCNPILNKDQIESIHSFWFKKSSEFLNKPGFHKVEQHTVSKQTQEKIIFWIGELREKIKQEVKSQTGEVDRVISINWSLTELSE